MRLHDTIVNDVPQLARGRVWCHTCGNTLKVDSAYCLGTGWPVCCNQTMSIDSPEERAAVPWGVAVCVGDAKGGE